MLPFLKNLQDGSASMVVDVKRREPDYEDNFDNDNYDGEYDILHFAAEDLMHAIDERNVCGIAEALQAAFMICGAFPDEDDFYDEGEW
jgi:hypothetical protein